MFLLVSANVACASLGPPPSAPDERSLPIELVVQSSHIREARRLEASADGRRVVTCDGVEIRVWDLRTGLLLTTVLSTRTGLETSDASPASGPIVGPATFQPE